MDKFSLKDSGRGDSEAGDSDYDLGRESPIDRLLGEGFSDLFLTDGRIPAGKSTMEAEQFICSSAWLSLWWNYYWESKNSSAFKSCVSFLFYFASWWILGWNLDVSTKMKPEIQLQIYPEQCLLFFVGSRFLLKVWPAPSPQTLMTGWMFLQSQAVMVC